MLRAPIRHVLSASILLLPLVFSIAGCGSAAVKERPAAAPPTVPSKSAAHQHESHGGMATQAAHSHTEADSDVSAELAKLPPADRALAEKQKVCPVSDGLLGSMGVPTKVTLKGRTVFLCCGGCEKELTDNADKYLAKLDKAGAK